MANLYKKPIVVTNPKTGKKFKTKSQKWWGRFRDHRGFEKRVPLARDKAAAKAMLDDWIRKEELRAAGRYDPSEEHLSVPLNKHIDAFEKHLQHKGDSAKHVFAAAANRPAKPRTIACFGTSMSIAGHMCDSMEGSGD